MQLRIIDEQNKKDNVRIELIKDETKLSFNIAFFKTCTPVYVKELMNWYFTIYPQSTGKTGDKSAIDKYIKVGQNLGDMLHGENFELNKMLDVFDEHGYQPLEVSIESANREFFQEMWEALVLPGSKYVLSTIVCRFVRNFTIPGFETASQVINYKLKTIPPTTHLFNQLLQDQQKINIGEDRPLNILHYVSPSKVTASNDLNLAYSILKSQGAIAYDLSISVPWSTIKHSIEEKQSGIHIFHYKGPVFIEEQEVFFLFGPEESPEKISLSSISHTLSVNGIALLTIDAESYNNKECDVNASSGLASIAEVAMAGGVHNVIGLSNFTDPWTSSDCFATLFNKLPLGLSLGQSVIELRKTFQINADSRQFFADGRPFQKWPLPVHYSNREIQFFEVPQTILDKSAPETAGDIRNHLFGFLGEMLPPLISSAFDGKAREVLALLHSKNSAIFIEGESGTGKTHTAHQVCTLLWLSKRFDYGFYFDYNDEFYTQDLILQMIAPVLEATPNNSDDTTAKIHSNKCCFVLDNVLANGENADESRRVGLETFVSELLAHGHVVILTGTAQDSWIAFPHYNVHTGKLSDTELTVLISQVIQKAGLTKDVFSDIFDSLVTKVNRNPWLIEKLTILSKELTPEQLEQQIKTRIENHNTYLTVNEFYEWQWSQLPSVWQKVLLLCHAVDGLLLEMFMIGCDKEYNSAPTNIFFDLLGEDSHKVSDGIKFWQTSGFLKTFSHGHVIDRRCFSFLKDKTLTQHQELINSEELQSVFSKNLCKGIELLAKHVISQPNPAISHNLLVNRKNWVKHFERLWFAGNYREFIAVRNAFEQLLKQAKLSDEVASWSLDLLDRSPDFTFEDSKVSEWQLTWLILAISSVSSDDAFNSNKIKRGVDVLHTWLDSSEEKIESRLMPLFMQATTFLDAYYQRKRNYSACIKVCEKACVVYRQYQVWQKLAQLLKALSRYYSETGELEKCLEAETKILDEIPYQNAPKGYVAQQMLEILVNRVARRDTKNARSMMAKLKELDDAKNLYDMLDNIQADIDFEEGNYLQCLPQYIKMWDKAVEMKQQQNLGQLKNRIDRIRANVATSEFENFANNYASND